MFICTSKEKHSDINTNKLTNQVPRACPRSLGHFVRVKYYENSTRIIGHSVTPSVIRIYLQRENYL